MRLLFSTVSIIKIKCLNIKNLRFLILLKQRLYYYCNVLQFGLQCRNTTGRLQYFLQHHVPQFTLTRRESDMLVTDSEQILGIVFWHRKLKETTSSQISWDTRYFTNLLNNTSERFSRSRMKVENRSFHLEPIACQKVEKIAKVTSDRR